MTFAPVPAREHAIVWEIRPEEARGALFEFGMEQRVVLRRKWSALRGAPLPSFLKLKQFRRVPVVVSLHPSLARTFVLPFRLTRKKSDAPIEPEQLQAMLREFLSKTTFEMRRLAGEELGVEELDAILLDARLSRLLADDVEVREDQPVAGRRIEGFLNVIFTTRAVFHDLHDLLHSGREIFFTERGPAALAFLGRHLDHPLTLLDLESSGGWLFRIDHDSEEIIKKLPFKWDSEVFPRTIAEAWGVSRKTSETIYKMYLDGRLSDGVHRFMHKILGPLEESFDKAIVKTKMSGLAYLRSVMPLPMKLPISRSSMDFVEPPIASLLHGSGITFELPVEDSAETSFFLLPFLEYYYHRGDPKGHRTLTRHIHWISA